MPREEMAASDALVAKMLESWLGLGPDIKQADLVAGMDEMPASSDTDETVKERMSSMNKALLAATLPVLEETGFVWAVSDFEKCILAMFKELQNLLSALEYPLGEEASSLQVLRAWTRKGGIVAVESTVLGGTWQPEGWNGIDGCRFIPDSPLGR
ncbi:unnamed protein product [Effrenium voratum]|uniref:Uncharacterized protein n=1 Tax=Effrenium voratum TaxID=2562239 RepID=A0AA36JGD5_9DINO|nr:unnamed protein product [Effrenium voratum]